MVQYLTSYNIRRAEKQMCASVGYKSHCSIEGRVGDGPDAFWQWLSSADNLQQWSRGRVKSCDDINFECEILYRWMQQVLQSCVLC